MTSKPIPPEELDEMQAYSDAATWGPWKRSCIATTRDGRQSVDISGLEQPTVPRSFELVCEISTDFLAADKLEDIDIANAEFIARARTDLPRLITAYREQAAELERLREPIPQLYGRLRKAETPVFYAPCDDPPEIICGNCGTILP